MRRPCGIPGCGKAIQSTNRTGLCKSCADKNRCYICSCVWAGAVAGPKTCPACRETLKFLADAHRNEGRDALLVAVRAARVEVYRKMVESGCRLFEPDD